MIKIHILAICSYCDGEAYLLTSKNSDRYLPCPVCKGSGENEKWVKLSELLDMLEKEAARDPMQPDYQALARQQPISQYQDSREAAGI